MVEQPKAEMDRPAAASMLPLRCPACRRGLELLWAGGLPTCVNCGWGAGAADATLDFVTAAARRHERRYYDAEYMRCAGEHTGPSRGAGRRSIESLATRWQVDPGVEDPTLRSLMGDLRGKTVLLLGNGDSDSELHFLTDQPERLVVSDLSPEGLRRIRSRYDLGRHEDTITFAAIDALDLPVLDASVDVVYGNALVHHLPDIERFLSEVVRVLRPGGRAVFFDNAYAPAWHWAKQTLLKPVMLYTHRRQPISPEDLRFTMSGGFRVEDLAARVRAAGGRPWFVRAHLLSYLWSRAAVRLFPYRWSHLGEHRGIVRALKAIDRRLAGRSRIVRQNLIDLYWGVEKPLEP